MLLQHIDPNNGKEQTVDIQVSVGIKKKKKITATKYVMQEWDIQDIPTGSTRFVRNDTNTKRTNLR